MKLLQMFKLLFINSNHVLFHCDKICRSPKINEQSMWIWSESVVVVKQLKKICSFVCNLNEGFEKRGVFWVRNSTYFDLIYFIFLYLWRAIWICYIIFTDYISKIYLAQFVCLLCRANDILNLEWLKLFRYSS